MGQHDVRADVPGTALREFQCALLDDLATLDAMQERGMFESGVRRIGAEQEMFVVDRGCGAAPLALEILRATAEPRLTTEIALFNLEANLTPLRFTGTCLRALEDELREVLATTQAAAARLGADIVLAGILPTLQASDLDLEHMTPVPRYRALAETMRRMRGEGFRIHIDGIEELDLVHDSVMLEACTTSFQLHWQVAPEEFVAAYDVAQLVAGPVLAAATNSPLLLGRRLWHETRVALFQQSIDARATAVRARPVPPRVTFGERWGHGSVTESFRENVERYRVLVLGGESPRSSSDQLARGEIPTLDALRLHNGTIYRWNRPCYGIGDGKPHLRIEARQLPAGPTILDEVANAALLFGLQSEGAVRWHDVATRMPFDRVKDNFFAAARLGLRAPITWIDGTTRPAGELLLTELVPAAERGLARAGIDEADAARYLGIVRTRVESARTGADWMLASLEQMGGAATLDRRLRALVRAMLAGQRSEQPIARWSLAPAPADDAVGDYHTVAQFMTTDLHTLRAEDAVDLAAALMRWEQVRHVPVEDDQGRLVGLVALVDLVRAATVSGAGTVAIRDVMDPAPVCVSPQTTLLEAIALLRTHSATALPVVQDRRLVGLVTERDLLLAAERVMRAGAEGGGV